MNEKPNQPSPIHNVDSLKQLINLPVTPIDVTYEQVPRGDGRGPGPTDYLLVAVMRFDQAGIDAIKKVAAPRSGSPPRISSEVNRPWFPAAIKAAIAPHDDHSVSVRGQKFDAGPFLKPPYSAGYCVVIEGGTYIVLSLQTT